MLLRLLSEGAGVQTSMVAYVGAGRSRWLRGRLVAELAVEIDEI